MITACYAMDLYCDETPDKSEEDYEWHTDCYIGKGTAQFAGRSFADCARQARHFGWLIGRDKQRAVCPRCRK